MRCDTADCAFCRIACGEAASHVVFEDEHSLAFLDHRPVFPGHSLLIPRAHHETLADLPAAAIGPLFARAQLIARAVEEARLGEGTFVAVNNRISQSVPHVHVHIVPRRKGDGLKGFFWPRQSYADDAAIQRVQSQLRAAIDRLLRARLE